MPAIDTSLQRELAYFDARRADLLREAKGKFALIKDDTLVDVFADQNDAIRRGYEEFGNEPFLVKQVVEVDIPLNFTSFNVGV